MQECHLAHERRGREAALERHVGLADTKGD